MNSQDQELSKLILTTSNKAFPNVELFDRETVKVALTKVKGFEEGRWFPVTELDHGRYTDSCGARYSKSLNMSMGKENLKFFRSIAPVIPGFDLDSVVINRYNEGDFIPPHLDRDGFMFNIIVPLTSSDVDGVTLNDTVYPDKAGVGHVLKGNGVKHWVSPVKDTRYTVMYLYI